MANKAEKILAQEFVCTHCGSQGGLVENVALSGTGISRFLEIQPYRYAFVSCNNCGFTEVYNLKILNGKDDLGTFLEILFAN
jgi:predicted nucleic-acid-binding Zn-ribbon protein